MRFKHLPPRDDQENSTRVQSGFLWFPLTIAHETRWLERAKWVERLTVFRAEFDCTAHQWVAEAWVS